jgi:6-phosphogluconolactonase
MTTASAGGGGELTPAVVVHADPAALATAAAVRLLARLVDVQAARGSASIVLTGGRSGAAIYQAVRDSPDRGAVDWSRLDIWWGDERFLPAGHPDRNDTQARAVLLDAVPLDPARVHPMPAPDGPDGDDPEAAAARYTAELATAGPAHFDLLLLGVGEEGHIASIFPGSPAAHETRPVVAVRGCPKPPPVRLTLTLPVINTAEEIWLLATGPEKADAVAQAIAGKAALPAGAVHATERTIWMLDQLAAAQIV